VRISIITVHPELVSEFARTGLIGKACEAGRLRLDAIDLKKFVSSQKDRVDDKPYGGGPGMILKCGPVVSALRSLEGQGGRVRRILLSAKGRRFTQKSVPRLLRFEHLVFVCGRYEGVDERVAEHYVDEEMRVGDFVLMGGEAASFCVVETLARFVSGVLGNESSVEEESFSKGMQKEYAQYTRPREFEGHFVPEVLISGNHRKIHDWRRKK